MASDYTPNPTIGLQVLELAQAVLLQDQARMTTAIGQVEDWRELALAAVSLISSNMVSIGHMSPEAGAEYLALMGDALAGGW